MKKIAVALLSISLLVSCDADEEQPLVGYVVYKEHTPAHMCHSDVTTYYEAAMVHVPHVHTHVHHHHMVEASSILYVADKESVHKVSVTESCWESFHVTDKVRVDTSGVSLLAKGCKAGY